MTARRAKRTPTPKATGTALRTTPGGRASATPKNQCRRLNAETRGRRPPARAEAIAPRLVPPRPAQQRPRRAEAIDTALSGMISATQRPPQGQRRSAGKNFRRRRFATLAHTPRRPQAAGATPSRRASMRRGPGSAFSKSRPLRRLNGSGRVSKNRERPGLSRHADGGSTSREQFAATFPRVPSLYCQSNIIASRSGLGNRPL